MVDLGLFNFIKNEIAKGSTKEQIVTKLTNGGNSPESIGEAYEAVINNTPPISVAKTPISFINKHRGERPTAITIICFILAISIVAGLIQSALLFIFFIFNPIGVGIIIILSLILQLLPFAVLYGYWMMRKWGVYLYGFIFVLSFVLSMGKALTTASGIVSSIVSLLILGVGVQYLSDMS
jgi:hypothetical protein